jgi:cytochrome c553
LRYLILYWKACAAQTIGCYREMENPMKLIISSLFLGALASGATLAAVPDSMAQRTAACVLCHGEQGRASSAGYFPRIAGKPQGYLYNQLINFRQGRRINPAMNHLVAHLSDDYLREIAAYFAAQHPPYPAAQAATVAPPAFERGRRLALEGDPARKIPACVACHGQQLTGVAPAIPGLLGLPRDYLNAQFGAWRLGVRRAAKPDCMAHIAGRLAPDDVVAVAAWLSAQPVARGYAPQAAQTAALPIACGGLQ